MATKVATKIELQFGDHAVSEDELVTRAKKTYGKKDIKTLNIYVKPEEYKVYYVVNDEITGSYDL